MVEQHVTTNLTDVALLGAAGVVIETNRITNLIEQLAGSGFHEIQVVFLYYMLLRYYLAAENAIM